MPITEVADMLRLLEQQEADRKAKPEPEPSELLRAAEDKLASIRRNLEYYRDLIRTDLNKDPYKYGEAFGDEIKRFMNNAVEAVMMKQNQDLLNDEIKQLAIIGKLKSE